MNKYLKNGLLVGGLAVVAYLLYREYQKKKEVVKPKPTALEKESPTEAKPVEQVLIEAPIN